MSITDTELRGSIYHIEMILASLVHFMILPHGIDEESLHDFLLVYLQWEDGIHQVGIVKHDLGWFLWEELTIRINHVDESCICQILDVVHHRSSTCLNAISQLTDIRSFSTFYCQLIEQSFDFV